MQLKLRIDEHPSLQPCFHHWSSQLFFMLLHFKLSVARSLFSVPQDDTGLKELVFIKFHVPLSAATFSYGWFGVYY